MSRRNPNIPKYNPCGDPRRHIDIALATFPVGAEFTTRDVCNILPRHGQTPHSVGSLLRQRDDLVVVRTRPAALWRKVR